MSALMLAATEGVPAIPNCNDNLKRLEHTKVVVKYELRLKRDWSIDGCHRMTPLRDSGLHAWLPGCPAWLD
jgi:hypothetical protein